MLNKCSVELLNALPLIWAHIYNDFCLITVLAWVESAYKNEVGVWIK
jgi:hypothetical protein